MSRIIRIDGLTVHEYDQIAAVFVQFEEIYENFLLVNGQNTVDSTISMQI